MINVSAPDASRSSAAVSFAGVAPCGRFGRCPPRRSTHVVFGGKNYLDPAISSVAAFGPATVANLGPGFDWLGCAIDGQGDTVTARVLEGVEPGKVVIESISGDNGRLSLDAPLNCAGIAAIETIKLFGATPACGIGLTLEKGLPLGSGMGSSAASAAAAAV